jgi:hypothetical protein
VSTVAYRIIRKVFATPSNLSHDSACKIRVCVVDTRICNGHDLALAILAHTDSWITLACFDAQDTSSAIVVELRFYVFGYYVHFGEQCEINENR